MSGGTGRIGFCQQGTVQSCVCASEQKNANGFQIGLVPMEGRDLSGAVEIDLARPRTIMVSGVRGRIDLRQTGRREDALSTLDADFLRRAESNQCRF